MKKWTSGLAIALSCAMLVQPLGVVAEEISTGRSEGNAAETYVVEMPAEETIIESETVIETEMETETEPSETEIETEPGEAKIEEIETLPETELEVEEETTEEAKVSGVEGFADRLYSVVLGRKASASEKANWINLLKTNVRSRGGEGLCGQ